MPNHVLSLPKTDDKAEVFATTEAFLRELSIEIESTDFDRPWGGFFVIKDSSTETFIQAFFPGYSYDQIANGLPLTPKILVVEPNKRLSWQYHRRREEIWSVISGPVGVITSDTDEQEPLQEVSQGGVVDFGAEKRHRLIGLDIFGVVAEFWKHTDPNNPSNELDIIRIEDDFQRAVN